MSRFSEVLIRLGFAMLALGSVGLSPCWAQSPRNNTSAAFIQAQSELVLVPVVVSSKAQTHVSGLRAQDFEILDNGKLQRIALFEEVVANAPYARRPRTKERTNYLDDDSSRRITVVLLDLLNTPYLQHREAQQKLLEALSGRLSGGDPIALLALTNSGIDVIHDFTTEPAILASALRKLKANDASAAVGLDQPSIDAEVARLTSFQTPGPGAWDLVRQRSAIDRTLEALNLLANAFAGLPGRKALIWASAGFPFQWRRTPFLWSARGRQATTESFPSTPAVSAYEKSYELFNSANVAIYTVDVRGLIVNDQAYRNAGLTTEAIDYLRWAGQYEEENTTTLINFGRETGGKAFVGFSDVAEAFRKALDDSRSYYLLGYYLNHEKAKQGWHRLRVKVARTDTEVRARAGFRVSESKAPDQIELALTSPLNFTAIPLRLRMENTTKVEGKRHIEFTVTLAAGGFTVDSANGNRAWLEFTAGIVGAQGTVHRTKSQSVDVRLEPESMAKIANGGLVYRSSVEAASGDHTLRVVVRDRLSERVGSLSVVLPSD